ncbi:DUF2281 domain-containing protein [Aphanothece sacrum]|uniref:DUF2281 domain-containing protein n=1 Tax=Aphanothece sacrum FPU1 TaxID=1920663 RepID=A0A401IG31_APHSA|nr:DUF2281 domain-containing protein [Aphanothece sacrum]GBF80171.1 hypothetical protein AsFPU1_1572 [Aphanothece sacrum FPU1]GBF85324.1 hypothetical protein AsFPU3_2383 [Aphanothece sacrum FPU3]
MNNQQIIETINKNLQQLPEDKLNEIANFVEQLLIKSVSSTEKKQFIRSLRGKYANSLTPTDVFIEEKQSEIDWEKRNL